MKLGHKLDIRHELKGVVGTRQKAGFLLFCHYRFVTKLTLPIIWPAITKVAKSSPTSQENVGDLWVLIKRIKLELLSIILK